MFVCKWPNAKNSPNLKTQYHCLSSLVCFIILSLFILLSRMEWLQLDLKTLSKRGNKFVSEIKCFSPPSKRAALGFFFFFFELKKKNGRREVRLLCLFNLLNCTKCSYWLEVNPQENSLAHHGHIIHDHINCDKYMYMHAFAFWLIFTWLFSVFPFF